MKKTCLFLILAISLILITSSVKAGDPLCDHIKQLQNNQLVTETAFNTTQLADPLVLELCQNLTNPQEETTEKIGKGRLKKEKEIKINENRIIEKQGKARIKFKDSFNIEVEDVDDSPNVYFSDNVVSVNTKELPELNQPATITLYNVDFETLPIIYYNEEFITNPDEITEQCPEDICYNINYDKGEKTISFDVAHFSSYKIGEGSWPIKNSENIISSGKGLTIGLPYGLYYDQWQYYFSPLYDYAACPFTYPFGWAAYQNCLESNILLPKCTQGSQIADDGIISYFPQGHSKLWGYLYVFDDDEYQFTTGSSYLYGPTYRSECFLSPDASRIIVEGTIVYTNEKTGGSGIPPCKDSLSSFAGPTLVRDWPGSSYGVDCMRDLNSVSLSKGFHQISAEAYSSYNYYGSYRLYVWKDYYPGISSPWSPPHAFLYKLEGIKGSFETEWQRLSDDVGRVELKNISVNATFNSGTIDIILYLNDTTKNTTTILSRSFTSSSTEPETQIWYLPPNTAATKIKYNITLKAEDPLTDIKHVPVLHWINAGYNKYDLNIRKIEPIQVIEGTDLVANKPMMVRVFAGLDSEEIIQTETPVSLNLNIKYFDSSGNMYKESNKAPTPMIIKKSWGNDEIKSGKNSFNVFGIEPPTQKGYITIKAVLDPEDKFAETNEENNIIDNQNNKIKVGIQNMPWKMSDKLKIIYVPVKVGAWRQNVDYGLFTETVAANHLFLRDVYPIAPSNLLSGSGNELCPIAILGILGWGWQSFFLGPSGTTCPTWGDYPVNSNDYVKKLYLSHAILGYLSIYAAEAESLWGPTVRVVGVVPPNLLAGIAGGSLGAWYEDVIYLGANGVVIEARPDKPGLASHEIAHTFLMNRNEASEEYNTNTFYGNLAYSGWRVSKGQSGAKININPDDDDPRDFDPVTRNDLGAHYHCFMGDAEADDFWIDQSDYGYLLETMVKT